MNARTSQEAGTLQYVTLQHSLSMLEKAKKEFNCYQSVVRKFLAESIRLKRATVKTSTLLPRHCSPFLRALGSLSFKSNPRAHMLPETVPQINRERIITHLTSALNLEAEKKAQCL